MERSQNPRIADRRHAPASRLGCQQSRAGRPGSRGRLPRQRFRQGPCGLRAMGRQRSAPGRDRGQEIRQCQPASRARTGPNVRRRLRAHGHAAPGDFLQQRLRNLYLGRQAVQHLSPGLWPLQQGQPGIPRLSAPVSRPHAGETQPRAEHCRPPLPDRSDQNRRRALPAAAPQSPDHPGHGHRQNPRGHRPG